MENVTAEVTKLVGSVAINFIKALGVLIIGWLIAYVISKIVATTIRRFSLDKKMASYITEDEVAQQEIKMEMWVSQGIFYTIMLVVLVCFFQTLGFTIATEPFNNFLNEISKYLPRVGFAIVLLAVAWLVASLLRSMLKAILNALNIDKRFASEIDLKDEKGVPLARAVSDAVYWLVILLFITLILQVLKLEVLYLPIQNMFNKVLSFLPNIAVALIILLGGWMLARIAQKIITNLLSAANTDKLIKHTGLETIVGKQKLSSLLGLLVYIMILVPVVITALDTLKIKALTGPMSNMLDNFLKALQYIIASAVLLLLAYLVARFVSNLITGLLTNFGFNSIAKKLGFSKDEAGTMTPSEIVGKLSLVAIMLFASIEACNLLQFTTLSGLISRFIVFSGNVLLGFVIFAIGLYLANLAYNVIKGKSSEWVAMLARICILVFAGAMALGQMGLAGDIINLAFSILFGSVAVAAAIAFGVGGRDFAARKIDEWTKSVEKK
ncbi:MAG: hypothetical protein A2017_03425 [Lentisphaerae bacterium GWF2_44_16]|nr:MAG: hypothetical protein A2017_03425 [Lentisphaerae bacterium GWF2_44_16]